MLTHCVQLKEIEYKEFIHELQEGYLYRKLTQEVHWLTISYNLLIHDLQPSVELARTIKHNVHPELISYNPF